MWNKESEETQLQYKQLPVEAKNAETKPSKRSKLGPHPSGKKRTMDGNVGVYRNRLEDSTVCLPQASIPIAANRPIHRAETHLATSQFRRGDENVTYGDLSMNEPG